MKVTKTSKLLETKPVKKLLNSKTPLPMTGHLTTKLASNYVVHTRQLNKHRNIVGYQTRFKLVLPDWRKRQLQRKSEYRKRKAKRKNRFLRWRAFRLKKRWKRSIARRFARSYLTDRPIWDPASKLSKRGLLNLRDMAGLQLQAFKIAPQTRFRSFTAKASTLLKTVIHQVQPNSAKLIKVEIYKGQLIHEVVKSSEQLAMNPFNPVSRLLSVPASELIISSPTLPIHKQFSIKPSALQLPTSNQFKFERSLVSAIVNPRVRAEAKRWVKNYQINNPERTFNTVYRRSMRDALDKFPTPVSYLHNMNTLSNPKVLAQVKPQLQTNNFSAKSRYMNQKFNQRRRLTRAISKWKSIKPAVKSKKQGKPRFNFKY